MRLKSRPLRLPVVDRPRSYRGSRSGRSSRRSCGSRARHVFAHFLGDEEEEVDDVLRLALEARAQHRVLRRDADRAGVEMALAHHRCSRPRSAARWRSRTRRRRAARRSRRRARCGCRRRPAPRCGRASRLRTSVWWVSARPISQGQPACLIEVSGRRAGAALEARDGDVVGARLGDARGDRADADFGHQLDARHRPSGLTFFRS